MQPSVESVKAEVLSEIYQLIGNKSLTVSVDMPLAGEHGLLDSMAMVELCMQLEDKAASIGFDFNWISDAGTPRAQSMFRTAGSLAAEFISQMESKK